MFMKPYDGGAWVGVTRMEGPDDLHAAYDQSGQRLMHLQKAVDGYHVLARSLSIGGAETMVMKFRPELPMHDRYAVEHGFLSPETGEEVVTISRLVNAFFRWEFNSCENLVAGTEVHPIDYANACPDVSLTSLHYYFPWAMTALVPWTVFCAVTGRRPGIDLDTERYFAIADRTDLSYGEKLAGYRKLADEYFETSRYYDFCASRLANPRRRRAGVGRQRRLRHAARGHREVDVPGARTRQVHRPLPRPGRPLDQGHEGRGRAARVGRDGRRTGYVDAGTSPVWAKSLLTTFHVPSMRASWR
jgi:hypothetical protein